MVPLGGLGEIGMNCLALEQGDDIIVIDCGVTFPSDDRGVDVLHPRFDYLLERASRVRGVVITHGHEDHIGALPYLLDELDVPVFTPAHARRLIERRLDEHRFGPDDVELVTTRAGERFTVGSFGIEPIRVTHSIVEATALAIETCAGVVIHTGDFKIDDHPADGELTDEARLRELGDRGVRLLFSDSTSIDSPGSSASEQIVAEALERTITRAPARVVIGMFASNVQRLIHVGAIARRTGRKVCLLGRSVMTHVDVARDLGRLDWPSDLVVPPDVAATLPPAQVLVVATGTQAETQAALSRLANGTHPRMRLDRGDMVILSSRIIPGNDRQVFEMMSGLYRAGIEVVTRATEAKIHTSGHGHREEQRRMLELTRPKAFIPVHGTLHHLTRHAELARETGVAEILIIENGEVVELDVATPPSKVGKTRIGKVATSHGEPIAEEVLRERGQIGRSGVATVALAVDRTGKLVAEPTVLFSGVVGPLEIDVGSAVAKAVARAVKGADGRVGQSDDGLSEVARIAARRTLEAELGERPPVLVNIVRVDGARPV